MTPTTKAFDGVLALDGASFSAPPGSVYALVGPNGSGKTTLLNVICGYIRPDDGRVMIGESLLPRGKPAIIARRIARTFQTPRVPTDMSVLDAVRVAEFSNKKYTSLEGVLRAPRWRRASRAETARARTALRWVGLEGLENTRAENLSLGQKRLFEIARALVREPRVLLLDEPASGLSEEEIEILVTILERLSTTDIVTVLVEHNATLISRVAKEVTCLASGSVIAAGDTSQVLRDEAVLNAWLGTSGTPEMHVN